MDITKFRSALQRDAARPNLFRVTLNLPAGLVQADRQFNSKFSFMCRAAQIPGSTLGRLPVAYMGREIGLAGNRTFTDWTVTILNDEDFQIRRTLEEWMRGMNSHQENVRSEQFLSSTSYVATGIVDHLGKSGEDNVIASYTIINAWPMDLSPIDLGWDQNDTAEEYTATFSMDYWE